MEKKLYKDQNNKMVCGVCAGLAKYCDMDVSMMRILWTVGTLITGGTAIIAYIACVVIMPDEPASDAE